MKNYVKASLIVLLFAAVAAAQNEVPKFETYLGFQYVRANQFNQTTGLGQSIGGFSLYGGDGQFVYNFSKWISFVVDAGAVNKPNVAIPTILAVPGGAPGVFDVGVQNTTAFVYGGPRVYFRKGRRLHPFAEVLFGGAFRRLSTGVTALTDVTTPTVAVVSPSELFPGPLTTVNARLTTSQNAFSMKVGGGLDWRLNHYFSFRPVEVDYVLTRFPDPSTGFRANQNSIAASAGVIFTFGAQ